MSMTVFIYALLCLIWGTTWLVIKIGLEEAPPLYSASLRFILSAAILTAFIWLRDYKYPTGIKNWLRLGYPGIFMFGTSYALVYTSEQYIASALTAILFASFPFFIAILSQLVLKESRPPVSVWLGLVIGFAGVAVVSYDSQQTSSDIFLGTVLALGASFASAYGIILHRKYFLHENSVVAINVQMIMGGTLLLTAAMLTEDWSSFGFSPELIGSILYLSILGTLVTFLGYYWLIKHISMVKASLIAFITPLVAILAGTMLHGEQLSATIFAGTGLILSGVVLVARK